MHKRAVETAFGTVDVGRVGYARPVTRVSISSMRRLTLDAIYEARRVAGGEPVFEDSVVLNFDGKGVVLHREDLREATRKWAERRRRQRGQLSPFNRLKPGEKKHSKRMAKRGSTNGLDVSAANVTVVWCPLVVQLPGE